MKVLRSKKMRALLAAGIRKSKRQKPPSDGYMVSLIYKTEKNGWHYQVEWVHDTRFEPKPIVKVYAFAPPRDFCARPATHTLWQEL